MSSTKSTPDEPGRGAVATGKQPAASTGGNGAAAGTGNGAATGRPAEPPADGGPKEAGNGSTVSGSGIVEAGGATPAGAAATGKAAPPEEAATAQFRLPPPAAASTAKVEPQRVPPTSTKTEPQRTPVSDASPARSADDGAAAHPPLPAPTPADPAGITAAHPRPAEPAPPTLAPLSAPAAVPSPGPSAAQPPPWRRMSNSDATRTEAAAPSTADRLLDDGPTAFLETPRYAQAGASAPGADAPTDTGSWTRIPRTRPPRQAALQLKRLDPWSVLKLALVLAVVLFFIWLVAVGVLYGVLDGMGVWDRLNGTYADLVSGEAQTGNRLISAGRVFGLAAVVGAINSLLFAVAVTVGAFVYNVSADLVGGIEVTLSERD